MCSVQAFSAAQENALQLQAADFAAASERLVKQHKHDMDQVQNSILQEALTRDAEKHADHCQSLELLKADKQAALDKQAAAHKSATDSFTQQSQSHIAVLELRLQQAQRDEGIRQDQMHSQHCRILDEWKAKYQQTSDAQAAAHHSATETLVHNHQSKTGKLEQLLKWQTSKHAEKIEQLIADKDHVHEQLCNDAAQLERTLLREHKIAMEAKEKMLSEAWQMANSQTYNANRSELH